METATSELSQSATDGSRKNDYATTTDVEVSYWLDGPSEIDIDAGSLLDTLEGDEELEC